MKPAEKREEIPEVNDRAGRLLLHVVKTFTATLEHEIGKASEMDYERLADALAPRLAPLIAAELARILGAAPTAPRYADAHSNPLGSARAFADAARRGDFPTFRRARRVTALWVDVEKSIESRAVRRTRAKHTDDIDPAKLLASSLARRRPRAPRVPRRDPAADVDPIALLAEMKAARRPRKP